MKISNQTLWAKRKIGSLKTFHFPHLKYQFPKGGEQNHPSVKKSRAQKLLERDFASRKSRFERRGQFPENGRRQKLDTKNLSNFFSK